MKKHGNKKDGFDFLMNSKSIQNLPTEFVFTDEQKTQVREFFEYYDDGDRSGIWRKNIVIWLQYNLNDWIARRQQLQSCSSNSMAWFELMYGNSGECKYKKFIARLRTSLPSTVEFWMNKGLSETDAKMKVSEHQRDAVSKKVFDRSMSVRCTEYWTAKGYSEQAASVNIAALQKRDRYFFQNKYGEVEGNIRFGEISDKKKEKWTTKDKVEHAKKAQPKTFNEHGQEMQAIRKFLLDNNIPSGNCMYGRPNEQFWQQIPTVGFRRYDLAVFDNASHDQLLYIVEYHGPGHINFSDYTSELENERITVGGKALTHLGTYGQAYHNDLTKRQHIKQQYPNCQYLVIWTEDLLNGDLTIGKLLQKRK